MNSYKLYYSPTCFYCLKVLNALRGLDLEVELVNVRSSPEAKEMLWNRRGRGTVPVLGILRPGSAEEELMGESSDIITYLREQASKA